MAAGQVAGDFNQLPDDPGCATSATFSGSNLTWENKLVARGDWDPDATNQLWFAYTNDRGLQATGLSADNPIFNQDSFQPSWGTNLDWTHVFSSSLVNDAAFDTAWYTAPFQFADQAAVNQVQPLELRFGSGEFDRLGSIGFPQGRSVTLLTLFDNANYTHGSHQFIFGEKYMRERVTDFDFQGSLNPEIRLGDLSELLYGEAPNASLSFPVNPTQPIRLFDAALYGGDTWQVTHNFTLTYGLRASFNSNPKDPQGVLGNPVDFAQMDHDVNISPATVTFGASNLYNHVPLVFWQPRIAFAYQPGQDWLVKGGWGMFETVAPAVTVDNMVANPPFDPSFNTGYAPGLLGNSATCPANLTSASGTGICGTTLAPNDPNSAVNATRVANATFQSAFTAGAPSCSAANAPANCIPANSLFIQPADGLKEPYADEWSFGISRQFGRNTALNVNYVGNRGYHNPLGELGSGGVDANGYQTECDGCFSAYPDAVPDARFQTVTQARFVGYSSYNGLQVGLTERNFHGLTVSGNYAWAHALGTSTPFADGMPVSSTYRDQGNTPFNVLSATYTYQLPWHVQSHLLGEVVNGWQISGATFAKSGDPIFPNGEAPSGLVNVGNASMLNGAYQLSGVSPYSKNTPLASVGDDAAGGSGYYQWLNPSAFASTYNGYTDTCYNTATNAYEGPDPATCQFPSTYANHLFGPGFEWTNFFLTKTFQLTEGMSFRFDAQAFNLFNHPNYADPDTTAVVPGQPSSYQNADAISNLASPATGLLGIGLGGDNAPRMVAFEGKIIF